MKKGMLFLKKNGRALGKGRLLLLSVVFSLLLSFLVSCNGFFSKQDKESLENNIDAVSVEDCETLAECLKKWEFPKGYDAKKLAEVEKKVNDNYYQSLSLPTLAKETASAFLALYYDDAVFADGAKYTDNLIRCFLLATGDDYAVYRTKEEYDVYKQSMSGSLGGIGITVRKNYDLGTATVIRVIDNSPAKRAGIQVGDLLYSVEGLVIGKDTLDDAFSRMQGDIGAAVRFQVLRGQELIDFDLVRENMENITVSYSMSEDKIAYISVASFKASTFTYFKQAVDQAEAAGAKGFIFDMRDNPGGYLSAVFSSLDYVAPKDAKILSYGVKNKTTSYHSDSEHSITVPVVVLCNGATASAGELFTAALRDYNAMGLMKVTVVGPEETFGKGIMQGGFHLSDGSHVTMTTAYYNPPSDVNYHGVGITPDVISDESDTLDVARQALLELIDNN